MDFQLTVQLPYLTIGELETIIKQRHGDAIDNLVLFKDDPRDEANKLEPGSEEKMDKVGAKVFYDYYPPLDPFMNRPTAHEVYATNPTLKTTCTEEYEGTVIKGVTYFSPEGFWKNTTPVEVTPSILPWSKTHEYDPHTAKIKAAEAAAEAARVAAAEAEAKRIADEEAARQEALREERAAKQKAKKEEAMRIAAEKAAEEAEAKRIAEEKEQQRLAEEAAARGEPPPEAPKAPTYAMPEGAIPPRAKGGTLPIFLGPTSKEFFGLSECTKDSLYKMVECDQMLTEIKDKGKISDLYVFKAQIEAYDGADRLMLFCLDRDELYSDEGMVLCIKEAEKLNFMASLAQGNGVPPPL